MQEFTFVVDDKFNNYKTVDFLKANGVSAEIIQKVKFGGIFVNGQILLNINTLLSTFDRVKMVLPKDSANKYIKPTDEDIVIHYEDGYFLAVNKEKGVLTHTSKRNETLSLEEQVVGYFGSRPFVFRAINRLDKDTSGIVLVAKDEYTACLLSNQAKTGKIIKEYLAIVKGHLDNEHFIIEKPIMRESEFSQKRVVNELGKYAKTEVWLMEKLPNGNSLVKIRLHTGRTHQIRVHLSSIGYPLYADALYGESVAGKS